MISFMQRAQLVSVMRLCQFWPIFFINLHISCSYRLCPNSGATSFEGRLCHCNHQRLPKVKDSSICGPKSSFFPLDLRDGHSVSISASSISRRIAGCIWRSLWFGQHSGQLCQANRPSNDAVRRVILLLGSGLRALNVRKKKIQKTV